MVLHHQYCSQGAVDDFQKSSCDEESLRVPVDELALVKTCTAVPGMYYIPDSVCTDSDTEISTGWNISTAWCMSLCSSASTSNYQHMCLVEYVAYAKVSVPQRSLWGKYCIKLISELFVPAVG
jgi:hypothetical protein